MVERRALLIGVPECEDNRFADIGEVVASDVRSMHQALEQSGYSISVCGVGEGCKEPTRSRIKHAIKQACIEAPAGSVLLLYFSGHGVTIDGRDYLVPSDAEREPGTMRLDPDALVPVIPSDLTGCAARLVVFFVDACRESPMPAPREEAGGGVFPYPSDGAFVLVSGCRVGQRCHYREAGSVFTQALAQVLDRRHPARTLSEVIDEVTREMRRKVARTEELRQEPEARHPAMLKDAATVEICAGDELTAAWRRAVDATELWRHCRADETKVAAMRDEARQMADHCARRCSEAYAVLREKAGLEDPWFDQNYPVRVLERCALLLGTDVELTPADVAVLVAAPFLREVVIAQGVRLAAGIEPHKFERTYADGARTDLETTHEMHQQAVRRAEGLERRGQTTSRDALAMWLVHQWLATRVAVWRSSAARECCERAAGLLRDGSVTAVPSELPWLAETALRAIGAEAEDRQVRERLCDVYVGEPWSGLAAVLWLAGILAADLRRMQPVIADHIGTHMEIPLSAVKNAADRIGWQRVEDALDLGMICDHPALHAAFEDIAERAERARTVIAELPIPKGVARGLPAQITSNGLRAERGPGDARSYETPIPRFRLAEDKIRELLMGRQLYDDPALAIRELYQNAMDACRYRRTRLAYLSRRGERQDAWTGRIVFRQDVADDGRAYIECEDNGVGMDADTLEHVFASAGERFVFRQEYRAEQADWQEATPPLRLVPNSQFGIGVFSYFMIADEIEVVTRPVDRNGIPAPKASLVRIASSGSLFQISHSEMPVRAGGTRIRLYLTDDGDEPISVLRTMRRLLWVAEDKVEVTEAGSVTAADPVTEVWEPRELRYQDESAAALRYGDDLWWVSGEGGLAADGIRTNEEIYGLIVNLRDKRRPQFTVDRKKLREWHKKWVREEIGRSLPRLVKWPGLTLAWLWRVAESAPEIAQQIFEHLVGIDAMIPVGSSWGQGASVRLSEVGCFPLDQRLFDSSYESRFGARWFKAWRAGSWAGLVGSRWQGSVRDRPFTMSSAGFPVIDAIDAQILQALEHTTVDRPVDIDTVLEAMAHPEQTGASRLRRLRRYAITGIDISAVRYCPPLDLGWKKKDTPLLRALAVWSPPGHPPRKVVAGWLVKASARLDQPLGEVLRRAAGRMPPGWTRPDLKLGELATYTCTAGDAKLLSTDLDGFPPWVKEALSPSHIVEASAVLGQKIEQVLACCDRFAPLGVTVAGRDAYPSDLDVLEVEALHHVEALGDRFTPIHLVAIAQKADVGVHETHRRLRRLESRGFLRLPAIEGLPDLSPGLDELEAIGRHLTRWRRRRDRLITDKPCLPIAAVMSGLRVTPREAARARKLVPFTAPAEPVTYPDLVDLAGDLFASVGEARRVLLAAFPDAEVPALTPRCDELYPLFTINSALIGPWGRPGAPDWTLRPGEILWAAINFGQSLGDFLSRLLEFRELGAPVPKPDGETMVELKEVFPDEHDHDMLVVFDDEGDEQYVSEIDPLHLVRTAGRLGWTLAEAHRRMSRLVPLGLRLDYPLDACPDEIVRWQDLLLLTEHFNGAAPAVSGRVSAAHITRATEETEESEEWIRERLRLYAPLFGLTIDPESSKEHADA